MTEREGQILEWITENPLISQQDLAEKAGITRSSVAVHISNLMKKGLIKGKGYIIEPLSGIAVVGGANIDIFGKPYKKMTERDSNPGKVNYSLGGVGRNIAHNLSLLTNNIKLITLLGDDIWSKSITSSCTELGIDTSLCLHLPGASTSTYLFITDESGDMLQAVSDMDIYSNLTPEFLESRMTVINNQSLCICDTNIPTESLEYLLKNTTCPVFVDTVSTAKAVKLQGLLDRVHTLKPNRIEAELLSGIEISNVKTLQTAAERILSFGVKQVFISMGSKGVYMANASTSSMLPCYPTEVVNTTGSGDAFMAGIAWSYINGMDIKKQALCGLAASAICVSDNETVSSKISVENIARITGIF